MDVGQLAALAVGLHAGQHRRFTNNTLKYRPSDLNFVFHFLHKQTDRRKNLELTSLYVGNFEGFIANN